MKLYLILSRSLRRRIAKEDVPGLTPAHREYHRPLRQNDMVLFQAMMRPDETMPKGSRCMVLQAETREEVEAFLGRNPLVQFDAMTWAVHELLPNYATEGMRTWFKGHFVKGHDD
jgi:hypothetical protein